MDEKIKQTIYMEETDEKSENPSDAFKDEEEELPPPEEENDAREVNVGNIIGMIAVGVIAIFLIAFFTVNIRSRKKGGDEQELDKAGVKTVIEFKEKLPADPYPASTDTEKEEPFHSGTGNNGDGEIEELPPEFQLPQQGEAGKAPVSSAGSTGAVSSSTSRPDTRNSRSPRKIDGLAGYDHSNQNSTTGSSLSTQNSTYNNSGSRMSREEFIAQQMSQTEYMQNQLYGNASEKAGKNAIGSEKENFFNTGSGGTGKGGFLSRTALWDGTIISGALVTAINTDNPGVVIARVTENVYSSQDHSYLLIPEGSLLMATYNSSISYGQNRVQVAWNLLIRPDNYRIQLGNMNGVNSQGVSGYEGFVNSHPFETLKALGMVAVYSLIQTETMNDISAQSNEYLQNAITDVYTQASSIGNKVIDRALDINPTIKIREGTEIKLITNTTLDLPPVEMATPDGKYIRRK